MLQAEARAHRIGQTQPVTIYKLCTQGTVEEQMMGRIQKKLYLSAKVTEAMRDIHGSTAGPAKGRGRHSAANDEEAPKLNTSQLMSLVRRGAQALSHAEIDVDEMVGWDFATMIDKCKDKPADIHVAESTQSNTVVSEEDEQKWLAQIEKVGTRVFEGKKYGKGKLPDEVLDENISRADRREGKNTTVMVDGFAISKESMNCAQWEAVPTFAGKDPRLAEPKRAKRPPIVNQEVCRHRAIYEHNLTLNSTARSAGTVANSTSAHLALEATTTSALIETGRSWLAAICSFTVLSISV
jgi:SWI/SNF-related matrix-associated actin-dependent regulator of chromatin subfamily A member 5